MHPNRKELEDRWRSRLRDAGLRYESARNYTSKVRRDLAASDIPPSDRDYTLLDALNAEYRAKTEYNKVLSIFTDLMTHGTIPDEDAGKNAAPRKSASSEV